MTRPRAARLDPEIRRGLIIEAAEQLLTEHDPLHVTFEEVAAAAGVSRALVHTYLGDRRGLVDAVQVRIVGRIERWVGHGMARASSRSDRARALVTGVFAFVEAEHEAWNVLLTTGGLDHPATHGLRTRWASMLSDGDDAYELAAQATVAALLLAVGGWTTRGIDPMDAVDVVARALLS